MQSCVWGEKNKHISHTHGSLVILSGIFNPWEEFTNVLFIHAERVSGRRIYPPEPVEVMGSTQRHNCMLVSWRGSYYWSPGSLSVAVLWWREQVNEFDVMKMCVCVWESKIIHVNITKWSMWWMMDMSELDLWWLVMIFVFLTRS